MSKKTDLHFSKHIKPGFLFLVLLALLVVFSIYTISGITLREDIRTIIPKDERIENLSKVMSETNLADRIILHFSVRDGHEIAPETLIKSAEFAYQQLENDTGLIRFIRFKNDMQSFYGVYDFLNNNLPIFLREDDFTLIENKLHPDSIEKTMEANFKSLSSLAGLVTKDFIFKDPLSITPIALKQLEQFQMDENFTIYNSCIFTRDLKHLLIFIEPKFPSGNTKINKQLISRIIQISDNVQKEFEGVVVEYYGGTAVAVENATIIKRDILLTVSIAFLLLLALFIVIFRKITHILLIFLPIALGILFALTILILSGVQISAISLGIGAILIGISIDYSLHAFSHYRKTGSMKYAVKSITIPVIMSSLTTASAFLCLFIVKSEALNQLGMFAALAVVLTALSVLIVLPVFFPDKNNSHTPLTPRKTWLDKIASLEYHTMPVLWIAVAILSILFFFTSKNLSFNSDLQTLNYTSHTLKKAEKHLTSISSETSSAVYCIVQGKNCEEALNKTRSYDSLFRNAQKDGLIQKYSSPALLLPSDSIQHIRIQRWNSFWNETGKETVLKNITEKGRKYFFKDDAFQKFNTMLTNEYEILTLDEFEPLTTTLLSNHINDHDSICNAVIIAKVQRQNKDELFQRFASHPDIIIFDNQHFTNQFLNILKEDFNLLVWLSIILVFTILLIFFGRIELAVIAFIPVILSWIWTVGIMGLTGIQFNIFNIIISTFILGLGVDYSIFMTNGLIKNHTFGSVDITPFKLSVLLSALTTILALGVLVFARHPALKSIALVSVAGIFSVIVLTFTLVPLLFRYLVQNRGVPRKRSVTFTNFTISVLTLLVYLFGSIGLTFLLPIIMLLPVKAKIKRLIVHFFICFTSKFIVFVNLTISKNYVNKHKLDFSKPVVLVSNHQSHLDLVLILLLNPKIIAFTNKWVWNSPFYGYVIRFAGFYPAFRGVDHDFEKLRKMVKEGYSILIFPEGRRMPAGTTGRMHQGAFYIAGKLGIDIQPLMIHGAGELLERNELFLKSGSMTFTIFDRIPVKPLNPDSNQTYRAEAKELTRFYRTHYELIRQQTEIPNYFRKKLVSQYIYKGPVLEWYVKIKLRLENNYSIFHHYLPAKGSITDLGCGYGMMTYMLGMLSQERIMTGVDYDEQKILLAKHCAIHNAHTHFLQSDILEYETGSQDGFILSDVLHYFNEEKQEKLITKCIENLNPGGTMIIRDADSGMKKRHFGTRYTEFFSTRTGFNKMGEGALFFTSADRIQNILKRYVLDVEIIDKTKLTSNILFIIRKPLSDENK